MKHILIVALLMLTACAGRVTTYDIATTPDGSHIVAAEVTTSPFGKLVTAWAEDPTGLSKPIPFNVQTDSTWLKEVIQLAVSAGAVYMVTQAIKDVDFTAEVPRFAP